MVVVVVVALYHAQGVVASIGWLPMQMWLKVKVVWQRPDRP